MAKQKFTAREIAEGILNQNKAVYDFLYAFYLPKAIKLTCKNKGYKEDGEELFTDVLIEVLKNYKTGKYVPENGTFDGYFNTIAKRLWINFLRIKGISTVRINEGDQFPEIKNNALETYKGKLYFLNEHMPKLDEREQKILELRYLKELDYSKIASILNLSSANYAKTFLHRTKDKLRNLITNAPEYNNGDFDIDLSDANIPTLIIIGDMHKNQKKQKQSPKPKMPVKELLITAAVAGAVVIVEGIFSAFKKTKTTKEDTSLLESSNEIDQFPCEVEEKSKTK